MSKFIEVDIANTDSKTLVNVDQIVNVGKYKSDNTGYISFNSSGVNMKTVSTQSKVMKI